MIEEKAEMLHTGDQLQTAAYRGNTCNLYQQVLSYLHLSRPIYLLMAWDTNGLNQARVFFISEKCYAWANTLPSKRNATLGSGAPVPHKWGQWPQVGQILLAGVVPSNLSHRWSFNYSSNSGQPPLLTIYGPHGAAGPILGAGEPLNQALHFFLRGVYLLQRWKIKKICKHALALYSSSKHCKSTLEETILCRRLEKSY